MLKQGEAAVLEARGGGCDVEARGGGCDVELKQGEAAVMLKKGIVICWLRYAVGKLYISDRPSRLNCQKRAHICRWGQFKNHPPPEGQNPQSRDLLFIVMAYIERCTLGCPVVYLFPSSPPYRGTKSFGGKIALEVCCKSISITLPRKRQLRRNRLFFMLLITFATCGKEQFSVVVEIPLVKVS